MGGWPRGCFAVRLFDYSTIRRAIVFNGSSATLRFGLWGFVSRCRSLCGMVWVDGVSFCVRWFLLSLSQPRSFAFGADLYFDSEF